MGLHPAILPPMRLTGIHHTITIVFIALSLNALAGEVSPQIISKKVAKAYKELNTYQSEGKILSTIETGGARAQNGNLIFHTDAKT